MTQLRAAQHTRLEDTVVEIWIDGEMVGVIYPSPHGCRVISKYLVAPENIDWQSGVPGVVEVNLK